MWLITGAACAVLLFGGWMFYEIVINIDSWLPNQR